MIKIYLFDLDDTLINTDIYAKIYQPILKTVKNKLNLTNQQLTKRVKALGLVKNKFGRWDTGELCRELELLEEYYELLEKHIQVIPVLNKLTMDVFCDIKKQKKLIGIVSNSMTRTIKAYLNQYELIRNIDFIFSSEDADCKKSEKMYWLKLIHCYKLNPSKCLVIGDDPVEDQLVPKQLGFKTLLITKLTDFKKLMNQH